MKIKLNIQDARQLYVNSLYYVWTICCTRLLFQFLSRGVRVQLFILIKPQNGRSTTCKNSHILQKDVLFEA